MRLSASNYVLGLMPLQVGAYLGGTAAGMVVWTALYTSLGGASRKLLDRGVSLGVIFAGNDPTPLSCAAEADLCQNVVTPGSGCSSPSCPATQASAHLPGRAAPGPHAMLVYVVSASLVFPAWEAADRRGWRSWQALRQA